jgi:hypothetical protein
MNLDLSSRDIFLDKFKGVLWKTLISVGFLYVGCWRLVMAKDISLIDILL